MLAKRRLRQLRNYVAGRGRTAVPVQCPSSIRGPVTRERAARARAYAKTESAEAAVTRGQLSTEARRRIAGGKNGKADTFVARGHFHARARIARACAFEKER